MPLKNLDNWIEFAEALLGRTDYDDQGVHAGFKDLRELGQFEEMLPSLMGMEHFAKIRGQFPWIQRSINIAKQQNFFHWELQFANIFKDGGFDLQVGNPPWVRPRWDENVIQAEIDPWFALNPGAGRQEWDLRYAELVDDSAARSFLLDEHSLVKGTQEFCADRSTYSFLEGTQPDFYRCFMLRVWSNLSKVGIAGLVHPGTHFSGKNEGALRAASYGHLRLHAGFTNVGNWAFANPVNRKQGFGLHVYGISREIEFKHLSELYSAKTLLDSFKHNGTGGLPGIKFHGDWDRRPHKLRIVDINRDVLEEWSRVAGDEGMSVKETKLLSPVSVAEQAAISALASVSTRLRDLSPRIASGFHEKADRSRGIFKHETRDVDAWNEVILQGPFFGIANPFAKIPNIPCLGNNDYAARDLTKLKSDAIPRTNYVKACSDVEFTRAQDQWSDNESGVARPYTDFYRVAWREMIPTSTERSLFPSLIPPGPSHVHAVRSMALRSLQDTVLVAGSWSALPFDYILRISGVGHLDVAQALSLPAVTSDHALTSALLLRTLRLNCLTDAFSPLWANLYSSTWGDESWAVDWSNVEPLERSEYAWKVTTPLRSEYERRAALVELDAIVAIMLGMTASQLCAIYSSRFSILAEREEKMYFDAGGRRIAADPYAFGYGQTKEDFIQLQAHLNDGAPPPSGYSPPFYKADRVAEMTAAHAEFTRRLEAKQREASA